MTTAAFIPQVYKAYKTKSVENISLTMYVVFFSGIVLWFIYGVYLDSWPMILSNGITALLALMVIIFKIKYK
ncbi:SemiSWEET transporter [Flavobacteriaceae bacterium F08102]|nr:SemiSWEET transporter [Flavobacteriaceae bacterium F08102]